MRQVPASVDGRAFTPTTALRPGEQVQVDTTRLDVLALFDDGRLARPVALSETIVVDRGRIFVSAAFTPPANTSASASSQPRPRTPTAKGIVERTFGTINALFCHRPHEGLRHPMMPRKALTPDQMRAALVAVADTCPSR
ncbi:hypothetical protein [Streptomyces sp. SID486]|uniref:hypothetical protein n=1 Tax=Streptomyces sp. SID486 TaxID=2690264 RepID=UPI0019282E29|nr:hypothetical protein [Streptomyces sp. SID486]